MVCPDCNGEIAIKKIPYFYRDLIYLGDFEAEICERCNSIYFTEESSKQIEIIAKQLRIWGRETQTPQRREISISGIDTSTVDSNLIFNRILFPPHRKDLTVSVI